MPDGMELLIRVFSHLQGQFNLATVLRDTAEAEVLASALIVVQHQIHGGEIR